jgi:hypothetical protein
MERRPEQLGPGAQERGAPRHDPAAPLPRPTDPGPPPPAPARGFPGRRTPREDELKNLHRRDEPGRIDDPSRRDEIDKIVPGPGHTEAVDDLVRERMEAESPDGRPPTLANRRRSREFFFVALIAVWVVVLVAVYWMGGMAMAALVLLLSALYIGYAAWPTWRAALERRADEHRAEREVEAERHPEAPPDRQPPAQDR